MMTVTENDVDDENCDDDGDYADASDHDGNEYDDKVDG